MERKTLTRSVLQDVSWNMISAVFSRIGALIFAILLARFLLPEKFGIYSLAMSVALIFMTFADMGINHTLIRYVSKEIAEGRKDSAGEHFKYILKIKLFLSIFSSIFLMALSYPLSIFIFKKSFLVIPLFVLGFYIFITAIEGFFSSLFYVTNKVKFISIKESISQISRISFLLIVFFILPKEYHIIGVICALCLTSLLALSFDMYYSKKFLPFLFAKSKKTKIDKRSVLVFLGYLVAGSFSLAFFSNVDMVMLGIFLEDVSFIGFYRVAFSLVSSVGGLIILSPILITAFARVSDKNLQETLDKIIKYLAIIIIPAAFGIAILGKYFIRIIYGYEYLGASLPLLFLSFVLIESSFTGVIYSVFSAKGKPKSYTKVMIISTILNIVLNFGLIYYLINISELWAIGGAAIATLISRYFYFFGLGFFLRKDLRLKFKTHFLIKPILSSGIMTIMLILILKEVKDINIFNGIFLILLGVFVYFLSLFLLRGFSKKDLYLIKEILPQKKKAQDTVVLSHRGLDPSSDNFFSESTLEAFKSHLDRGFGIEFDMGFSKDSAIAYHDETLKRMTGSKNIKKIEEISFKELKKIEKTYNIKGSIPKLNKVLELIQKSNSKINALHIKGQMQTKEKLEKIKKELVAYQDIFDRLIIFDLKPHFAVALKKRFPKLQLGISVAHDYDIKRYGECVSNTLFSIKEAEYYKDIYNWAWMDEWDLLDENKEKKRFYTKEVVNKLRQGQYKISIVSPELHGSSPGLLGSESHEDAKDKRVLFKRIKEILKLLPDAICTDYPEEVSEVISKN